MSDEVRVWRVGSTLVAHGSSWAFKPGVTREDYAEEFSKNESKAQRDFGAQPPKTVQSALHNKQMVELLSNKGRVSPILDDGGFAEWFVGDPAFEYYMHIDMSKEHDSTGIGLCHYDISTDKIVVDLIHNLDPTPQWKLTFERVFHIVMTLHGTLGFRLKKVTFDQWQSAMMIERLINAGVTAENYSVDRGTEAYDTLIEAILGNRVDYYYQARFVTEMSTLKLYKGLKYDHPPGAGSSKDVSDAVAGCVTQCVKARTGLQLTDSDLTAALYDGDLFKVEVVELDSGANAYQMAVEVLPPADARHTRVVQIYAVEECMVVLWGWHDKEEDTLRVEKFLVWQDYANDLALRYLEMLMLNLSQMVRIGGISLNDQVPLDLVSYLKSLNLTVSSPLLSRVSGSGGRHATRTTVVSATMVRMMLAQLKKNNLTIPRNPLLSKDLKYLTDGNMLQRRYVCALAAWTDFATREMTFGRASRTMPASRSASAPPAHVPSMANSNQVRERVQASPFYRQGDEIGAIRQRYNTAYNNMNQSNGTAQVVNKSMPGSLKINRR